MDGLNSICSTGAISLAKSFEELTNLNKQSPPPKLDIQKDFKSKIDVYPQLDKQKEFKSKIDTYTQPLDKQKNKTDVYTQQQLDKQKEFKDKADFYHARGFAKRKRGDFKGAIADYTKAIELNPRHFKAYFNRGFSYDKLGMYDKAIENYTKALEVIFSLI